MKDSYWIRVVLSVTIALTIVVAYVYGNLDGQRKGERAGVQSAQKAAVEQGVAQYDALTGEWRWKNADEMAILVFSYVAAKLESLPAHEPRVFTRTPEADEASDILPPPDLLAPAELPKKKK